MSYVAMCTCKKKDCGEDFNVNKHKSYHETEANGQDECVYCGYYVQYRKPEEASIRFSKYVSLGDRDEFYEENKNSCALDVYREKYKIDDLGLEKELP